MTTAFCPPNFSSTDGTLEIVQRARAGEPSAWEAFYRRFQPLIRRTASRRLGRGLRNHLDSQDVAQSVALDAYRTMKKFEPRSSGAIRGLLRKMVDHKIRDRADYFGARKRAGTVPLTDSLAGNLPAQTTTEDRSTPSDRLDRAMSALPAEMREVLELRRLKGFSGRETAERMGKSDVATRKLYSRAVARLHLLLTS